MKKIILLSLLVLALLVPGISRAQTYNIPNGSFENWTSSTAPKDWVQIQGTIEETPIVNYTLTTTTTGGGTTTQHISRPAKDGSESILLYSMNNGATPCVIAQKFAMAGRPQFFSMNYSYFPGTSTDQFQVEFIFTKWNSAKASKHDTLLSAIYTSAAAFAEPWQTILNQSLTSLYSTTYPSTENPDSATILITNDRTTSTVASALYIDEIWFPNANVSAGIDQNGFQPYNPSGISVFPNPFSAKTTIHYNVAQSGQVSLNVYDVDGKQVASLVNGNQEPGAYDAIFDASGLKNGVYFYRLQGDNEMQTGKLILNK